MTWKSKFFSSRKHEQPPVLLDERQATVSKVIFEAADSVSPKKASFASLDQINNFSGFSDALLVINHVVLAFCFSLLGLVCLISSLNCWLPEARVYSRGLHLSPGTQ